jgi:hypothetical protein
MGVAAKGSLVLFFAVGVSTMSMVATARSSTPPPEGYDSYVGYVVDKFNGTNGIDPVGRPADSDQSLNPYGGAVGPGADTTGPIVIDSTQRAQLNLGEPGFRLNDVARADLIRYDADGLPILLLPNGDPDTRTVPPSIGGSPIGGSDLLFGDAGLDPMSSDIQMLDGRNVVVASNPAVTDNVPYFDVVAHGASVTGPLPLDTDCGGNLIEIGWVYVIEGGFIWPADFAPNDTFKGGSIAFVTRCEPGRGWYTVRLDNQGQSWSETTTRMFTIVHEGGIVSLIRGDELQNTSGYRTFSFITPGDNPYQPDTVAFFADPLFPGFTMGGAPPLIIFPPYPGEQLDGPYPMVVDFEGTWDAPTDGSSGCNYYPSTYTTVYELYVAPDGGVRLYDVMSGQSLSGTGANQDGTLQLDVSGGGEGFSESLTTVGPDFSYLHSDEHGECTYDGRGTFQFDGSGLLVVDQPEIVMEPTPAPDIATEQVDSGDDLLQPTAAPVEVIPDNAETGLSSDPPSNDDESGSGLPWLLIFGGGAVAVGGGALLLKTKREEDSAVDDSLPGLDDDETVATSTVTAVAEEPSQRQWDDSFLRTFSHEDAEWELGDADLARWKQLMDTDATSIWVNAEAAETRIQADIKTQIDAAMGGLSTGLTGFSTAVNDYSTSLNTVLKESEPILELWNEWSREGGVKDIMWWADLAEAVAGVGLLATKLGVGSAKLVIRLGSSTDEVVDGLKVVDEVVEAAGATDEVLDGARVADEADAWIDVEAKLFDDFGDWLEGFTGMKVQDWGNGLDLRRALLEAARRLGHDVDLLHDVERIILQRIIAKLHIASKGNKVVFDAKDLAWLRRMSQNPDFWTDLQRAVGLDLDARVYKLVDDVELDWLKRLAGSDEAAQAANAQARAAGRAPVGGATVAPPSAAPPVTTPTVAPPGGGNSPFLGSTVPPPNAGPPPFLGATVPPPSAGPAPFLGQTLPPPDMATWRMGAPTVQGGGLGPSGFSGAATSPSATPTVGEDLIDTIRLGAEQAPTLIGDLARTIITGGTP